MLFDIISMITLGEVKGVIEAFRDTSPGEGIEHEVSYTREMFL